MAVTAVGGTGVGFEGFDTKDEATEFFLASRQARSTF